MAWNENSLTAKRRQEMEAAQAALAGYGSYESAYKDDLDSAYRALTEREKFSYDLGKDQLWKQYKDHYVQQGRMAMQDTIGQASAMTGGYGNSYAATVGNQAFQQQLQQLNDRIPALYQMALDSYNAESDRLQDRYDIIRAADAEAYGRWQDGYNRLADAASGAAAAYDRLLGSSGSTPAVTAPQKQLDLSRQTAKKESAKTTFDKTFPTYAAITSGRNDLLKFTDLSGMTAEQMELALKKGQVTEAQVERELERRGY